MLSVPIDLEVILPHGHVAYADGSMLEYDPADPLAVTMAIADPLHGGVKPWIFARDVLADGLCCTREPGDGDVRVWRCGPYEVHITLDSPEGTTEMHADPGQVDHFLTLSYLLVPLGHELDAVDAEAELDALLDGAA
ncbi:SsgA family sporulation/cell division regulator [Streptomyces sp. NPDC059009]|uniref:SsgA family sporulation/cell division regulator n=1 Tax=Streptomyces sp. NPDC059009 TaxID=3346694 RepID=UPI00368338F5